MLDADIRDFFGQLDRDWLGSFSGTGSRMRGSCG